MVRSYIHRDDYEAVGAFLIRTFRGGGGHVNWMQPRWEYMHFHPYVERVDLTSIGVWEADGRIVGVVHPEHDTGTVYLEIDPDRADLVQDMLTYAEEHLCARANGLRRLRVYVNDADEALQERVTRRSYVKTGASEPMSRLEADRIGTPSLPAGFRLQTLADDNDPSKIRRVMWRGFDHGDEPPDDGVAEQARMQSAPDFRTDLNVVVVAPDGALASYCGMWYEPVHRVAYVEPVATDPDYRRMGLGRAAVLEGVRRCVAEGASAAYVGTDMPFYRSLGFRRIFNRSAWVRQWRDPARAGLVCRDPRLP